MCNLLWEAPAQNAKNPAGAGFFDVLRQSRQSFPAADWRAMKLS